MLTPGGFPAYQMAFEADRGVLFTLQGDYSDLDGAHDAAISGHFAQLWKLRAMKNRRRL